MAVDAELSYLEPTVVPSAQQDPSLPVIGHTDAETTGRTDADGTAILRQRVATPTIPNEAGTWDYRAGTSGTVAIPAGGRVLGVAVWGGGSFTINGGNSVVVPNPGDVSIAPRGQLIAPSLVFTGTGGYFVEFVT